MIWLKFSYDVKIDFHFRMLLFPHLSLTIRFFVTGEQKFLQLKKERKVGVLFQTINESRQQECEFNLNLKGLIA